jgi:hypothetical protein
MGAHAAGGMGTHCFVFPLTSYVNLDKCFKYLHAFVREALRFLMTST